MRIQLWPMEPPFAGGAMESGRYYVAFLYRKGEVFDPEEFGESLPLQGFGIITPPGPADGFGNISGQDLASVEATFDRERRCEVAGDDEAFAAILECYMSIFVRVDTERDVMSMVTADHMRDFLMFCDASVLQIVEFEEGELED